MPIAVSSVTDEVESEHKMTPQEKGHKSMQSGMSPQERGRRGAAARWSQARESGTNVSAARDYSGSEPGELGEATGEIPSEDVGSGDKTQSPVSSPRRMTPHERGVKGAQARWAKQKTVDQQ
jgi:hypothetical protein